MRSYAKSLPVNQPSSDWAFEGRLLSAVIIANSSNNLVIIVEP